MGVFDTLFAINVNDKTEKKPSGGKELTYLSWPYAWAEVKRRYPDASYEIERTEDGLPYVEDPCVGYMVFTKVTIDGVTHEMWLPVMDASNNAMKRSSYVVKTKYKETTVQPAAMTDVNKAIMRCLVKNLAMFGMGLYIYAGEDLPVPEMEEADSARKEEEKKHVDLEDVIKKMMVEKGYKVSKKAAQQLKGMDMGALEAYYQTLTGLPDKKEETNE